MQGFRPRRHAATPCSPVLPKHTRPKQATHRLTPTDLGHTRQRLCVIQKASHKDVSVFVTHRASLSVPRARPRTARLCPWIVRACREIDGWIASVTKAAKIFCVRGCLRTGVHLCADVPVSPRKCGSLRSVLVDARLSTRARLARLSAAACSWSSGDALRDPAASWSTPRSGTP